MLMIGWTTMTGLCVCCICSSMISAWYLPATNQRSTDELCVDLCAHCPGRSQRIYVVQGDRNITLSIFDQSHKHLLDQVKPVLNPVDTTIYFLRSEMKAGVSTFAKIFGFVPNISCNLLFQRLCVITLLVENFEHFLYKSLTPV